MGTILVFGMAKDHEVTHSFPMGQPVWNLTPEGIPKEIIDFTNSYLFVC